MTKPLEDYHKPPRMALYVRVSTEDQAKEGYSLEAQEERMKAYCKAQGFTIYRIFREEGESGRTIKRSQYQAMMDEIGFWDGILVMKMDRIHRNSRNFMEMMDLLRAKDKQFVSMQETLDTSTAMGRFVMNIIQGIAQLESEQTGERVLIGMTQKAMTDEAGILGFNAPYGYDFVDKELTINKDEAPTIEIIFNEYIKGKTLQEIAVDLNTKNIRTKKGTEWSLWSVRYVLSNPIYAGYLNWNGNISRGTHESIIDVELYNEAQTRRKKPIYIEN